MLYENCVEKEQLTKCNIVEKEQLTKCNIIKEQFLEDENFKNKRMNIYNLNKSLKEILFLFCNSNQDNEIIIDYRYFKLFESIDGFNKDYLIEHVIKIIKDSLMKTKKSFNTVTNITNEKFVVHLCLHSLSISDLEKYYPFIYKMAELFKVIFPDNLEKCFIYKAPFIFSQFFSIISTFIDKKTTSKIELIP
jgi:hypothetical protein